MRGLLWYNEAMKTSNIDIPIERIEAFCKKWKVREFSLFGSVLRDDFRPDSDVDVLLSFEPNDPWSYWDWPAITDDLVAIFGRKVDLVEKEALRNPIRRKEILETRRVVYAAA